ncbi:MAG: hypothetical protein RLZZ230_248 [Candidatus Parcubacteria bacterium]|jgi:hypothetical protein
MQGQINAKVVGATIIGFALIAGAFTIKNITTPKPPVVVAEVIAAAPIRTSISITDTDSNGVEDWRDEFITAKPVRINVPSSTYILPDTLTGKMSIDLIENLVISKSSGPVGKSKEELVNLTADRLVNSVEHKIYDTADISVIDNWTEDDLRNYANTVAATILKYSLPNKDGELTILYDILVNKNSTRAPELKAILGVYNNYRDDTLKIPVPALLVKEHLDLINTYQAISEDVSAFSTILDDPVVTLLYLKRYDEDATGLGYALQNIYKGIKKYGKIFHKDDPAILFGIFSPDYKQ